MSTASSPMQPLWQNVVSAEAAMRESLQAFLHAGSGDRAAVVRKGLRQPGPERAAAMRVLPYLLFEEREELFPDLVELASTAHGGIQTVRDAIRSLPRDWVLAHIEEAAEPLLKAATAAYGFEEYRRILELYHQLGDRDLTRRLAERALAHEDEDVREAGQDALDGLAT